MAPISAKEFEKEGIEPTKRQKGRRQQEAMRFLNGNAGSAYTQGEVQEALSLSTPQHARSILLALEAKGRVERKAVGEHVYYCTSETKPKK